VTPPSPAASLPRGAFIALDASLISGQNGLGSDDSSPTQAALLLARKVRKESLVFH